jgi:hypothetical protein
MRRTMFVVPNQLASVVDAACTRALAPQQHRRMQRILVDNGVTNPERWIARVCDSVCAVLEADGPMTGRELVRHVPDLRRKLEYGQGTVGATTRVLFLMATEGVIVRGRPRGSWVSSQYEWNLFDAWANVGLEPIPEDEARIDLVARYVAAFGPVTENDIQWWSGWNMGDTRSAIDAAPIAEVQLESGPGFVHADDLEPAPGEDEWVAVLPGLDPSIMGYKDRDFLLGPHEEALFDATGNAGPLILVNGRAVGGWGHNSRGQLEVEYLEPVSPSRIRRIDVEVDRLTEWLEGTVIKPRFAGSLWRDIAAR